jgi:hypothetical protein
VAHTKNFALSVQLEGHPVLIRAVRLALAYWQKYQFGDSHSASDRPNRAFLGICPKSNEEMLLSGTLIVIGVAFGRSLFNSRGTPGAAQELSMFGMVMLW